jgi:hypothetical protein
MRKKKWRKEKEKMKKNLREGGGDKIGEEEECENYHLLWIDEYLFSHQE